VEPLLNDGDALGEDLLGGGEEGEAVEVDHLQHGAVAQAEGEGPDPGVVKAEDPEGLEVADPVGELGDVVVREADLFKMQHLANVRGHLLQLLACEV